MRMFLLFLLLFSTAAHGQRLVKGVILDEKGIPVPAASVFLNNTSVGTRSADNGQFLITVPAGRFELIVTCVGFETYNQPVSSETTDYLTIRLKNRTEEMETVVIEPYEKNGWDRWGRLFTENFIGTSDFASRCLLKNPEVLRFRHSKKNGTLTATALEPLIVENESLGYRVRYQMESFVYDFRNRYLIYTGFPFFEPMKGGDRKQRRWQKNRQEAYAGSMMQFMRSVYRNTLAQEGFEIRSVRRIINEEKLRVKAAQQKNMRIENLGGNAMVMTAINRDSAAYYQRILKQEDYEEVIGQQVLPGDSIAYAVDSTTAGMSFPNYLLVIYTKKPAPEDYTRLYPKSGSQMISQLTLMNGVPIEIQANGLFYNPTDLLTLGYWAWSEKLARMLPYDYKPE